jgi:glutamate synthase domain-containing protein 3
MGLGSSGVTAATFENGDGAIAYGTDGRVIVNGFLTDTFANGSQGVQLYENEINSLASTVPDTGSTLMLLTSAAGVLGLLRRRIAA